MTLGCSDLKAAVWQPCSLNLCCLSRPLAKSGLKNCSICLLGLLALRRSLSINAFIGFSVGSSSSWSNLEAFLRALIACYFMPVSSFFELKKRRRLGSRKLQFGVVLSLFLLGILIN
jgi:hypothetical protein